jgi:hypothetical protein
MAFATSTDVATRLGRDLTAAETTSLGFLLDAATEVICAYLDREYEQIDPVPPVLNGICVSMILRALANPSGLASRSETLGAYSHSENFRRDTGSDLSMTPTERDLARRALYGSNLKTVRLRTPVEFDSGVTE